MTRYPDIHDVVDTDSPTHWLDDLRIYKPQKEKLAKLWEEFNECHREFLEDAAAVCGLDTSEWEDADWWDLEDFIDDYR